jgi:hypothetical protein
MKPYNFGTRLYKKRQAKRKQRHRKSRVHSAGCTFLFSKKIELARAITKYQTGKYCWTIEQYLDGQKRSLEFCLNSGVRIPRSLRHLLPQPPLDKEWLACQNKARKDRKTNDQPTITRRYSKD